MKALMVAIRPKWLKMILDGDKKFEFRNWKVPVGTVLYFYECLGKFSQKIIPVSKNNPIPRYSPSYEGRGKVVAKAVVKENYFYHQGYGKYHTFYDNISKLPYKTIEIYNIDKIGFDKEKPTEYALELDQVQKIEPRDITEFVSWSKLDIMKHASDETLAHTLQRIKMLGSINNVKLTHPLQSRTWIYVSDGQ